MLSGKERSHIEGEEREFLVANGKTLIMNVSYSFVNGLKLAKDAFVLSANANVDGKKALGITSHPNIPTPSSAMLHVCHYVYGDPAVIGTHLWPTCVNLCLYVGNP